MPEGKEYAPKIIMYNSSLGECCDEAGKNGAPAGKDFYSGITYYQFNNTNKECRLFTGYGPYHYEHCTNDTIICEREPPSSACECERVFKAVGRQNKTDPSGHRTSYDIAGGEWYSHPSHGECQSE